MKVQNIKKGLYTDGKKLYTKECGIIVEFIPGSKESGLFLASGVSTAKTFDYDTEVKKAKARESFFNGDLEIISKDTVKMLRIFPINPEYNEKGHCIALDGYGHEFITRTF